MLLACFALAAISPARAVPLDDVPIGASHLNVESGSFLGSGAETTYLVIDFRAAGGGSFAFGYRHDGMNTAQQMLETFDAEGVLEVFLEDFSFGPAVRGIAYPREEQEDVFSGAFSGPRSWVLWEGSYDGDRVEWATSNFGINGIEFGNTEPTIFLPGGGFYALSSAIEFPGAAPLIPLPGDFNSDGVVDGDDLKLILLGFGTTTGPTLEAGDADRDGDTDRTDLALWQDNVGARIPTPIEPVGVPEPPAAVLACLVLWSAATCRRFRFHTA
jgi:hypothetical protein